jgi:shikimate kinase
MKKHSSLALIGFRATGKSTIGGALAQNLGWTFMDMDALLMESFGRDINAWVRLHGWKSFREAEAKLLMTLSGRKEIVLSTGGGVILSNSNRETLKKNFDVVWLQASPEIIYSRLKDDPNTTGSRPALTDLPLREEIEQTVLERQPLYRETADYVLDTDFSTPIELTDSIFEWLLKARF